jgi:hypothetical protein
MLFCTMKWAKPIIKEGALEGEPWRQGIVQAGSNTKKESFPSLLAQDRTNNS